MLQKVFKIEFYLEFYPNFAFGTKIEVSESQAIDYAIIVRVVLGEYAYIHALQKSVHNDIVQNRSPLGEHQCWPRVKLSQPVASARLKVSAAHHGWLKKTLG